MNPYVAFFFKLSPHFPNMVANIRGTCEALTWDKQLFHVKKVLSHPHFTDGKPRLPAGQEVAPVTQGGSARGTTHTHSFLSPEPTPLMPHDTTWELTWPSFLGSTWLFSASLMIHSLFTSITSGFLLLSG